MMPAPSLGGRGAYHRETAGSPAQRSRPQGAEPPLRAPKARHRDRCILPRIGSPTLYLPGQLNLFDEAKRG